MRDYTLITSLDDLHAAGLLMAAPLTGAEGALLGCITVTSLPFLRLTPASLDRLGLVADWGARTLENARTHTPAATPIDVRVAVSGADAVIEVTDRGPGMTPEVATHAFELAAQHRGFGVRAEVCARPHRQQ